MSRLSKSIRRFLAIGLLVLSATLAVLWIALPIAQRFQELNEGIADQHRQLAQYAAFAGQEQGVRVSEQRRRDELAAGEFLSGDDELANQTSLHALVSAIAQTHRVRLLSARKLPPRERAPLRLAGLAVTLTADIEHVQIFLHAVENARPYLLVEAASVAPLGGANPPPTARPLLELRLEIFAAYRRES